MLVLLAERADTRNYTGERPLDGNASTTLITLKAILFVRSLSSTSFISQSQSKITNPKWTGESHHGLSGILSHASDKCKLARGLSSVTGRLTGWSDTSRESSCQAFNPEALATHLWST